VLGGHRGVGGIDQEIRGSFRVDVSENTGEYFDEGKIN
jgi:hypothetical protein